MGTPIENLPAALAAERLARVPIMKDGVTRYYTVGQILDLLIGAAPGQLDTLEELATALNDDADFAATITAALAAKADASTTEINSLTSKTTPVDADELRIADSEASFGFKKLTFANMKAWINAFLSSSGMIPSSWVAYTPTFTGFGTVTNIAIRSRRVGQNLEVFGTFKCGTTSASTAQITLGFNGVDGGLTVASYGTGVPGVMVQDGSTGAISLYALSIAGEGVIRLGSQSAASAGLTSAPGNTIAPLSNVAIKASIPITGW